MFKNLKLSTKFTLLLFIVFVGGIALCWLVLSQAILQRAEDEVTDRSLILVGLMNSVRNYTSTQIRPLLNDDLATAPEFIPQTVPAFSAREVFEHLRKSKEYESFFYKEATLNPTNTRNKADDFEAEIVNRFRSDDTLKSASGFRTLENGEQVFYNAWPLAITQESCLACHSTPDAAPKSLVQSYGTKGGFGWQLGEIVSAQMIYVPASDVLNSAQTASSLIMGIFISVFAVVTLMINFQLRRAVIRPITALGQLAAKISNDEMGDDKVFSRVKRLATRQDELGQSAQVFIRMANQIEEREKRLKAQVQLLKIEIDENKKRQQVAEITETDYFQTLQQKSRLLRDRSTRGEAKEAKPADVVNSELETQK